MPNRSSATHRKASGGYDAAKKVLGRKRHDGVDIDGRLLAVKLTSADIQDQDGGITQVKWLVPARRHFPSELEQ